MDDSSPQKPAPLSEGLQALVATRPRIILGSGSATRKGVLRNLGLDFEVLKAGIDEKAIRCPEARDLVMALAHAKAAALKERLAEADPPPHDADAGAGNTFLITADQVVVHEGRILEKPESLEQAREYISGYGRAPAETVGAIVVENLDTNTVAASLDLAKVYFEPIPESVIDSMLEEGFCLNCAGGLMVEHPLIQPLTQRIEGTMDSVMGMGSHVVSRLLLEAASIRSPDE